MEIAEIADDGGPDLIVVVRDVCRIAEEHGSADNLFGLLAVERHGVVGEFFNQPHPVGITHTDCGVLAEIFVQISQGVGDGGVEVFALNGLDQVIAVFLFVERLQAQAGAFLEGFLPFFRGQAGAQGVLDVGDQVNVGAVQDGITDADLDLQLVAAKDNLVAGKLDLFRGPCVGDEVVAVQLEIDLRQLQALDGGHADAPAQGVLDEGLMNQLFVLGSREQLVAVRRCATGQRSQRGRVRQNLLGLGGHFALFGFGPDEFSLCRDQLGLVGRGGGNLALLQLRPLLGLHLVVLLFDQVESGVEVRFLVLQLLNLFDGHGGICSLVHQLSGDLFELRADGSQFFF